MTIEEKRELSAKRRRALLDLAGRGWNAELAGRALGMGRALAYRVVQEDRARADERSLTAAEIRRQADALREALGEE